MNFHNRNKTVWLIDDDAIHNMAIEILIKKSGFADNVICFNKARRALEELQTTITAGEILPDCIFLDLNMNDMNGWEFLEEYETFAPKASSNSLLNILSSSVSYEDRKKAQEFDSVHSFLTKPITLSFFQQRLTESTPL